MEKLVHEYIVQLIPCVNVVIWELWKPHRSITVKYKKRTLNPMISMFIYGRPIQLLQTLLNLSMCGYGSSNAIPEIRLLVVSICTQKLLFSTNVFPTNVFLGGSTLGPLASKGIEINSVVITQHLFWWIRYHQCISNILPPWSSTWSLTTLGGCNWTPSPRFPLIRLPGTP